MGNNLGIHNIRLDSFVYARNDTHVGCHCECERSYLGKIITVMINMDQF